MQYLVGSAAYWQMDPATGQVSPGAAPKQPEYGPVLKFPSPDGNLVAELRIPEGSPDWDEEPKPRFGDSGPGFAWRQDSAAVAALDTPDRDHLAVKLMDLQGQSRVIAEKQGQGVVWEQYAYDVAWSPLGSLIKFGDQLVEVASGRLIAENLARTAVWSPDGKALLLHETFHPFTSWGPVSLLDVATGKRQELGDGQGLGWLPTGEALFIRWDLSKQIPGPGKDC